jgi:hypothetical protein
MCSLRYLLDLTDVQKMKRTIKDLIVEDVSTKGMQST